MDMDVEEIRKFLGQLSLVNVVALDEMLTDDLARRDGRLARHHVRLGKDENDAEVALRPYGTALLVAGSSGGGAAAAARASRAAGSWR